MIPKYNIKWNKALFLKQNFLVYMSKSKFFSDNQIPTKNCKISKKSLNLIKFFEIHGIFYVLVPSLRTWKLDGCEIFSLHTNWDFRKNLIRREYIDKIQEASHGRISKFLLHFIWTKMEKKKLLWLEYNNLSLDQLN